MMAEATSLEAAQYLAVVAGQELWRREQGTWMLRPEQVKLKSGLEREDVQLAVFNICRRLGKTFVAVLYSVEEAERKKQNIRYGCAFLTDLEEFVLPAFDIILEMMPPESRPFYRQARKVWSFKNGSRIKLVGLDKNPNGLRGNAINKIIVDEAGFVRNLRRIYINVIVPATAKQSGIKVIFLSSAPEDPEHYFVELMQKAQTQANGFYAELTIDEISDLSPAERKRLLDEVGGEDSDVAQREFFCKIIIDASIALCKEFDEAKVVRPLTAPKYCKFWLAGDVGGVRDRTVFHLLTYDFERAKVMFLDEREFPNETGTTVWVKAVREMEGATADPATGKMVGGRKLSRHVDCPGQLQVDLMADHGFACSLPRKDELDATIAQVRTAFIKGQVEIDPKCRLLILTLKLGTLNKKRTDLARTEALGHMDAFMSGAYGIRHANKSNPFPPYDGANHYTHYIDPTHKPLSPTASNLRGLFKGPR